MVKKNPKPYYKKKWLMMNPGWEDIKGKRHLLKQSAQLASFLIIMRGRLLNGFPVVLKKFWYSGIAIYPFVFIREDSVTATRINHEMIHIRQQVELLIIFGYLWYAVEYFIRFLVYGFNFHKAYYFHSMEREARIKQNDGNYLLHRKWFAFFKYIK